jgi:hypothetical protein
VRFFTQPSNSGSSISARFISVLKKPGAMALTWMLRGPSSTASARVSIFSPPLAAA